PRAHQPRPPPRPRAPERPESTADPSPARSPSGQVLLRYPQRSREKGERMPDVSVTWLGHASFRVDSPGGKRIYVDPWLGNPKCPESEQEPERVDVIALTHGHGDHVGETVELSKKFSPEIVALVELKTWLGNQGAETGEMPGPNKGGTVEAAGCKFTITNAFHSSATDDLTSLGEAAGIVIELENGTKLYFAGDTCVFGDMQLIARFNPPDGATL